MVKKFLVILLLVAVAGISQTADPGRTPRWDGLMDYVKNGQYTFTYKTLTSPTITGATLTTPTLTGATVTGGLTLNGNISSNNLFVVSEGDSFKVRMYKYLYPLEIEIGNAQKAAIDSAGNAIFAGTVSAAAFSPTTSSAIQSRSILVLADGDSITADPTTAQYMLRVGVGGAKKFAVDSAGNAYAVSLQTPTLNGVSGAMAVTTKLTVANNYPFVTSSTITADSIIVPVIAGVANAMAVNAKLNIAANYPLVSSSSVAADTLKWTNGNINILDVDTVATAGGTKRWLRFQVTKNGATGKPEYYYMVSDTSSLY